MKITSSAFAIASLLCAGPVLAQTTMPSQQPSSTMAPKTEVQPAPMPSAGAKMMSVPQTAMVSYSLIGLNIYDASNSSVGEIKDLVIDKGQLAGYILSVGGFLGMGEHYVAVTPSTLAITYSDADKKWKGTINATKDELKAAPQFKYEGKFNH